jgi:4-aminobutyrate aminotransferase/(S)-3-amino-2-methylpropionate transaminase
VNSGAEAVENAVKIARAATGRPGVVVFDRAFHGRTNLTMAMTSKLVYKQGFGPLAPEVYRAPAPYPYRGVSVEDALAGLELLFAQDVSPDTVACVVLETVQGEGGFIPMPEQFVRELKAVCERHGIVYVADEVQSGSGRTGTVWAIERLGVEPDLLVAGKTLGGGLPLASVTGRAELMDAVHPGGLGGTYGGNPIACAASLAAIETMRELDLPAAARHIESLLVPGLSAIADRDPGIAEVRGRGAMIAVELVVPGTSGPYGPTPDAARTVAVSHACHEAGLLTLTCGTYGNVLRFLPPLVITDDQVRRGLEILGEAFAATAAA